MRERSNRDRVEIIRDILETCSTREGANTTHIIQKGNLTTDMARMYISHLIKKGVIEQVKPRNYHTTIEGRLFARHISEMLAMLDPQKE